MSVIKVPTSVAVSPQDASPLKYETLAQRFVDANGNKYTVDELAACRPGNRIKKWVRENYPESTGES